MSPEIFFLYLHALNSFWCSLMIELLNICFMDNTDLVLWLTYIIHEELHLGSK